MIQPTDLKWYFLLAPSTNDETFSLFCEWAQLPFYLTQVSCFGSLQTRPCAMAGIH